MEYMIVALERIIGLCAFAAMLFVIRMITITLHEFGHAIPCAIFTKGKIVVFLGTYGDKERSFRIPIGRFEVWWLRNPFLWRSGVCTQGEGNTSFIQNLLIILLGPLASFIIAGGAAYIVYTFRFPNAIQFFIFFFLGSAIIDLLINLIPSRRAIILESGNYTFNDGSNIVQLIRDRKLPESYNEAIRLYNSTEYKAASIMFERMIEEGCDRRQIYEMAMASHIGDKNYERAETLYDIIKTKKKVSSNLHQYAGYIKYLKGEYEDAIVLYRLALKLNEHDTYAQNNVGHCFNILGKYEHALHYLNKAVNNNKKFAYAYNNRGYAKIKLGFHDEGLEDVKYSLQLDEHNAQAIRNIGVYYLEKGQTVLAMQYFEQARNMDPETEEINQLLESVRGIDG